MNCREFGSRQEQRHRTSSLDSTCNPVKFSGEVFFLLFFLFSFMYIYIYIYLSLVTHRTTLLSHSKHHRQPVKRRHRDRRGLRDCRWQKYPAVHRGGNVLTGRGCTTISYKAAAKVSLNVVSQRHAPGCWQYQ